MTFEMIQVLLTLLCAAFCQASSPRFAIISVEGERDQFCASYFPNYAELPNYPASLKHMPLVDLTAQDPCQKIGAINLNGKLAVVYNEHNCSCSQVIRNVQATKPAGLVVYAANPKMLVKDCGGNGSGGNMVLVIMRQSTATTLLELQKPNVQTFTSLYTSPLEIDPSLPLIALVAVGTVAVGAYLSGSLKYRIYRREVARTMRMRREQRVRRSSARRIELPFEEDSSLDISIPMILVFVGIMCLMLMTLYFLIAYLTYLIIPMFALASLVAIVVILEPLVYKIPIGTSKLPAAVCPCFIERLEVRQAALILFAFAMSLSWVVYRHASFSWILQNILGFAFCVSGMISLRLPTLRVIATFLLLLLCYDFFFVFVTPYLTKEGESVMVSVAKAAGSTEKLPATMRVPRWGNRPLAPCINAEALLGYGDIMVPGLLVSYCRGFDLINTNECYYYLNAVVFYAIGLVTTFMALIVMGMAQPALIYLVPCTLFTTIALAWYRGQLTEMWNGTPPALHSDRDETSLERAPTCDQVYPSPSPPPIPPGPQHLLQKVDAMSPYGSRRSSFATPESSPSPLQYQTVPYNRGRRSRPVFSQLALPRLLE